MFFFRDLNSPSSDLDIKQDDSNMDIKKILTKGALKIFEGIKVSIPTQEINLAEVLNASKPEEELLVNSRTEDPTPTISTTDHSLKLYKNGVEVSKNILKTKPKKRKRTNYIKTIFTKRRTKIVKKPPKIEKKIQPSSKAIAKTKDVYDFEDSQDEFIDDLNFKPFRDKKDDIYGELNTESESDNHDYMDAFSLDESSSDKSDKVERVVQKEENMKTMIMGRIFKHAVKPSPSGLKDVNTLFDSLLSPKPVEEVEEKKVKVKKVGKKVKESSSDDEFYLNNKKGKKRGRKVKEKVDSGINLEQEIRECIGVAGRKSQRKCTSGKQNVLVEFWSSDEQSDIEKSEPKVRQIRLPTPPVVEKVEPTIQKENANPKTTKRKIKRKVLKSSNMIPRRKGRVPANINRKCSKIRNKIKQARGRQRKKISTNPEDVGVAVTRRKRSASEKLYYWSSSSDDEFEDLIEVKPIREDPDDDRPMHHGWIVGDSPKKLVTMLAQAKGNKKVDAVYVKEQVKRNRATL